MMRKGNMLIKTLLTAALLVCALALAGTALAEEITVVEFTLYADGSDVSVSYSLEKGEGYDVKGYMALNAFSFVMDPTGGPASMSAGEITAAWEAGMREWNNNLVSPLFTMNNKVGDVTVNLNTSKGTYNGVNTISFADLGGNVLAVTKSYLAREPLPEGYPVAKRVVEADVIFDKSADWTDVAKGGRGHDLRSIATHELGHALGLGDVMDSAYSYVTMYGYGMSNDISQRTLAKPDLVGLSKMYQVPGYGGPVLPTPTPVPTATPVPTTLTATVNTTSSGLNLRAQPSTAGAWITAIPRGATVTVLEKGDPWSSVSYGAYTGYVMSAYLAFNDPNATATPEPSAPVQTTTARVNTSGSLNLRSAPSTSSTVVTRIPSGATVSVISYAADWSRVTYRGYTGYVSSQYIVISGGVTAAPTGAPTPVPQTTTARVNASTSLNLRKTPSTSSSVLTRIPSGATVKVLSHAADWSRVTYNGYTGYVSSQYITLTGPAPTTAPTSEPSAAPTGSAPTTTAKPTASPTDAPSDGTRTVSLGGMAEQLNMRAGAGSNYLVIGFVPDGGKVTLLAEEGSWSKVEYGSLTGYVMSAYLK